MTKQKVIKHALTKRSYHIPLTTAMQGDRAAASQWGELGG